MIWFWSETHWLVAGGSILLSKQDNQNHSKIKKWRLKIITSYPKTSENKEQIQYRNWYESLLEKWHLSNTGHSLPYREFQDKCCLFITMTFPQDLMSELRSKFDLNYNDYTLEFDSFHRLYIEILKLLFGKHHQRAYLKNRLPLAIVAIDFEGSRYANSQTISSKNPHIHAVMAVHPDDVGKFRQTIKSARFRLQFLNSLYADKVQIDDFSRSKSSIGSAAGYAAKSHVKSPNMISGAGLIRIYPHSNYNQNGVTYKQSLLHEKADNNLRRMRQAWRAAKSMDAKYEWYLK